MAESIVNDHQLEWVKISEGPWTKWRKHQLVVWNFSDNNSNDRKILLLGGFDGETAFDLNDVWSWEEDCSNHNSLESNNRWELICEHAGWSGRDGHCAVVKLFITNILQVLCCRKDL